MGRRYSTSSRTDDNEPVQHVGEETSRTVLAHQHTFKYYTSRRCRCRLIFEFAASSSRRCMHALGAAFRQMVVVIPASWSVSLTRGVRQINRWRDHSLAVCHQPFTESIFVGVVTPCGICMNRLRFLPFSCGSTGCSTRGGTKQSRMSLPFIRSFTAIELHAIAQVPVKICLT